MKREDLMTLLVYTIMIAIAVVVGVCIIGKMYGQFFFHDPTNEGFIKIVFLLFIIIIAIVFNAGLVELGHMAGAKSSGYKLFSINILGLCFYKNAEKWKVKLSSFNGLTGETKIAPVKEDASPRKYSLMPIIFYAIEAIILVVISSVLMNSLETEEMYSAHDRTLLLFSVICIVFVTIGGMINMFNIFPAKLDTPNDGYRLTLLSKKENLNAFNELMRIECAYSENKELDDIKVFEEINDFTSSINLYTVYKHLKNKNYNDALVLLDKIIENKSKVTKETYFSAVAQKLFIILLTQDYQAGKNCYDTLLDASGKRFISNDLSMPSLRAYMLISSLVEISEHEARYAKSRVPKALKRTLPGRVDVEKELYQIALTKINEVRPEWHILEAEVK